MVLSRYTFASPQGQGKLSYVEKYIMEITEKTNRQIHIGASFGIGSLLALALAALAYVLSVQLKLHRASRPGREVSANI